MIYVKRENKKGKKKAKKKKKIARSFLNKLTFVSPSVRPSVGGAKPEKRKKVFFSYLLK